MKNIIIYISLLVFTVSITAQNKKTEPVDHVSTLVGTFSKRELSTGNTYPAIAMPWGMNFWTPQTGKMGNGWGYTYTADKIRGFKQTHQPSPWMNDYGQFAIMPVTNKVVFNEDDRASWFSHKAEIVQPHYYSVYLADHDVTTEITPTERAAMFRFTFPETDKSYIIVDAFDKGSYIKIIPEENKIIGYTTKNSGGVPDNFKNYFVIKFDKAFAYISAVDGKEIKENLLEVEADHTGAIIGFTTKKGEQVHARVASSFISHEQAEINLKELKRDSFDTIVNNGRKVWNNILGRIEIEDENIDNLRTFYSCFYRTVLFPRSFYEINKDGKVMHYSPYNGQILPGYMFADTGFWDTFRSLFPFLNLMFPSMNEKMQEGLVNAYKESGFLPEWSSPGHRAIMIGNNSTSVVADAYVKGLRGYDIQTLWQALKHGANSVHPTIHASGRTGFELYNQYGYIPSDKSISQNVARTLEYAYNDWTIYTLGKKLGKPVKEIEVYAKHAMNYKNLFDPQHNLMRPKLADGSFKSPFKPTDWSVDYTEGNSWHYSWSVFHDPQGLVELMGGKDIFNNMLDSVFIVPGYMGMESRRMIHEMREMQVVNMGQYAHGNQPIQHMIYLYNYSGQPWKTQYWSRVVMDKLYNANPDGYCGDEDNGQTSAWYVFSALGMYTVCPGTDEYIIGSPLFDKVRIKLENGKQINILANNNSKNNCYVRSISVDGKEHSKNYFTHSSLTNGADIRFEMSSTANKFRGIDEFDFPYSFSADLKKNDLKLYNKLK